MKRSSNPLGKRLESKGIELLYTKVTEPKTCPGLKKANGLQASIVATREGQLLIFYQSHL